MKEVKHTDLRVGDVFTNVEDELMVAAGRTRDGLIEANRVDANGLHSGCIIYGELAPYTLVFRPKRKPELGEIYRRGDELYVAGPNDTATFLGDRGDKFVPGISTGYPQANLVSFVDSHGFVIGEFELVGNMTELMMGLL